MDENQLSHPKYRSVHSNQKSFVRFINNTPHSVTMYWMDYEGHAVDYGVLLPRRYKEINTFVTHPWIFVNTETGDRYLVDHRDVFYPRALANDHVNHNGLRPPVQCKIERTNVYIVLPMFTLQELSLRVIKKCLKYDYQAFELEIPRSLQVALHNTRPKKPRSKRNS